MSEISYTVTYREGVGVVVPDEIRLQMPYASPLAPFKLIWDGTTLKMEQPEEEPRERP